MQRVYRNQKQGISWHSSKELHDDGAELFRALDFKSGGPWLNPPPYCYLDLFSVVPCSTPRPLCINNQLVANWSAPYQFGFLMVHVLFAISVYLFIVSLISTIMLSTFDTKGTCLSFNRTEQNKEGNVTVIDISHRILFLFFTVFYPFIQKREMQRKLLH